MNQYIPLWTLIVTSILAPVIIAIVNVWLRRQEKAQEAELAHDIKVEEWRRQDAIALKLENTNRVVAIASIETKDSLKEIHTLVNGNLTEEMSARLLSLKAQLVLMEEVITLNEKQEIKPSEDALEAISAIREKIQTLESNLSARQKAENKIQTI